MSVIWQGWLNYRGRMRARQATRWPSFRTRDKRRRLAGGLALICAVGLGAAFWSPQHAFAMGLWGGSIFSWLFVYWVLRETTSSTAESPAQLLDEWELGLRNRAGYYGYQAFIWLSASYLIFLAANMHDPDIVGKAMSVYSFIVLTVTALPSIVVGWQLPDDEIEGEPS
ncbi:hypothetical protein D5S17_29305 [Pseudonocardiaceae bacterium YIM PH 21723]|nr:hypothetical protein D5S17_29305 [Pseudonocardiaceae bacterium YIM PH 21723]